MKIGQASDSPIIQNSPPSAGAANAPKPAPEAAGAASQAAKSAGVAVTVSTQTRALDAANRGEASDVNMDKVNAVRTAIANGTYAVNPQAIADKLLSNAQEMLRPTHH